jgi:hypothetical protein
VEAQVLQVRTTVDVVKCAFKLRFRVYWYRVLVYSSTLVLDRV